MVTRAHAMGVTWTACRFSYKGWSNSPRNSHSATDDGIYVCATGGRGTRLTSRAGTDTSSIDLLHNPSDSVRRVRVLRVST
jgi:hypothetical protein